MQSRKQIAAVGTRFGMSVFKPRKVRDVLNNKQNRNTSIKIYINLLY